MNAILRRPRPRPRPRPRTRDPFLERDVEAGPVLLHLSECRTALAVARTGLSLLALDAYAGAAALYLMPGVGAAAVTIVLLAAAVLLVDRGVRRYKEGERALAALGVAPPPLGLLGRVNAYAPLR